MTAQHCGKSFPHEVRGQVSYRSLGRLWLPAISLHHPAMYHASCTMRPLIRVALFNSLPRLLTFSTLLNSLLSWDTRHRRVKYHLDKVPMVRPLSQHNAQLGETQVTGAKARGAYRACPGSSVFTAQAVIILGVLRCAYGYRKDCLAATDAAGNSRRSPSTISLSVLRATTCILWEYTVWSVSGCLVTHTRSSLRVLLKAQLWYQIVSPDSFMVSKPVLNQHSNIKRLAICLMCNHWLSLQ